MCRCRTRRKREVLECCYDRTQINDAAFGGGLPWASLKMPGSKATTQPTRGDPDQSYQSAPGTPQSLWPAITYFMVIEEAADLPVFLNIADAVALRHGTASRAATANHPKCVEWHLALGPVQSLKPVLSIYVLLVFKCHQRITTNSM
jgi:hypothetical protein